MSGFAFRVDANGAAPIGVEKALDAEGTLVWLHLEQADAATQAWLIEAAGLPEAVASALTAAETRPRCEAFDGGAILNLRGSSAADLPGSEPLASIRLFASAGHVLSVTRRPLQAMPRIVEAVAAGRITDPGDLIAIVATAITEVLDPEIAELGDALDICEEQVGDAAILELRARVRHARIAAIGYRRFLAPQRDALERLAALSSEWLNPDDRQHLATAADRAARMAEEVESIRERAALLHETLSDLRAEEIDQRALVISVVAMVFLPLTFLTGLLGMNVRGIPYAEEPWAFWGVLGGSVVLGAVIAAYFVSRHWFQR